MNLDSQHLRATEKLLNMIYLRLIHRTLNVNLIELNSLLKSPNLNFRFICKNKKNCQKRFLESSKHVFLHDYFLHMQFKSRVRDFEPHEYKIISQMI